MKTVVTFGVFDILHLGHILLFKNIKDLYSDEGCKLIVAVQDSDTVNKYKPGSSIKYSTEIRHFMVSSIKYVDQVIIYKDVDIDIQSIDFDVFAKGPDQIHSGFARAIGWCNENGKDIVTIPRTKGISTSILRHAFND